MESPPPLTPPSPPVSAAPPRRNAPGPGRSRHGCLLALVVVQSLLIAGGLFVFLVGMMLSASVDNEFHRPGKGVDEYPALKETWSYGNGNTKVVVIPLQGMILINDDGFFPAVTGTAEMALRSIRRATHDKKVKAIILAIDSGGGGITASDILYEAVRDFKQAQEGRKVVTLFGDVGASGAYYVAAASDHIMAHPTTITGSIGVLMQRLNFKELGQNVGVKDVTIKSGKNKDLLNPLQDMTEEQRAILQKMVDQMYDRFVEIVVEGRGMTPEEVKELADGSIFTAAEALDSGLVDEIGYWKDAVAKTASLLKVSEVKVYRYEQEFTLSHFFRGAASFEPVVRDWQRGPNTRLMYLWDL